MKTITSILTKVFVVEFYQHNASFFLLIGGLCFGFMSGVEHKALAQYFVSSPLLLTIPISCWTVYTWKVILFNRNVLQLHQNEFVFHLSLIKISSRALSIFVVIAEQLLPILMYATFLIIMALGGGMYSSVVYIVISIVALLILSTVILIRELNNPNQEKRVSWLKAYFDNHFKKTFYQFFVEWISRKDLTTLIGSKSFSCLILYAVLFLYKTDNYDARLLGLGVSIAFSANASLAFQFHQFENIHFFILRNLPLRLWKRLFYYTATFILLCLPEFSLLIRNFPSNLHFSTLLSSILFSISLLLIYYTLLYRHHIDMEKHMRFVFFIVMGSVIAILFSVPMGLLAGIYLITGIYLFRKYYYNFEFIAPVHSRK
ncbi:MAG TPA: hypothetical protein VL443_16785 [Cyclobacteriaceae bacterium]|nr:hypothetical protein [Cyclobacteriaceae bacterium]